MISLKNLNLNRDEMEKDLESNAKIFFGETAEVTTISKGLNRIIRIMYNNVEYVVNVSYKSNGTTSLWTGGAPDSHILTDAFITKIEQDYSFSDKKTISFSISSIDEETYKFLISYFETDIKAEKILNKTEQFCEITQFKGNTGDLLTIKRFKNGNTQFQGKPLVLYTHLCDFLVGICSASSIIQAQQQVYDIHINDQEIDREYEARFNKCKGYFEGELKDIILPVFTLMNVKIPLTDYSLFVFPMLKGLEGYMKSIFKENGIIISERKENSLGSHFASNMEKKELNCETQKLIKDKKTQKALGELYTLYFDERNSIIHVDGGIINTRIIDTRDEADSIIDKIINLIESTYIDMHC